MSVSANFVSTCHYPKPLSIKTFFRRLSSEANKKQGLCNINYDLNLFCMRLTSISECECNIMLNNHEKETYEMLGSMYVSFIVKISET